MDFPSSQVELLHFACTKNTNIGLQFLASGSFDWNPPNFMKSAWNPADFMKSGRFQVKSGRFHLKSTHNLIKSDVSTKTLQFGGCMEGAMTPDFMKSSPAFIKLDSFGWNTCFYKVLGGFHMKSRRISPEICRISGEKSPDSGKIRRILWMWAFGWWSSIGLSFERPNKEIKRAVIETTGVWRHDDTMSRRYDITSFCDTHWSNLRFIGLFFSKTVCRIHRCLYRQQ